MIELRKYFNDKYGRGVVKMVAQVYDSIIFECAPNLVEEVKTAIKTILSKPFLINGRSFTPLFELKDGERWSEV
jgi:DNA polymerase I-like protein with 3'-5' exonuclease and polymerase domains